MKLGLDRMDEQEAAAEFAAAVPAQLPLRDPRLFLLGIALYGSVFILPVHLSRIQGYNAEQIGMVLAWTGLPQLLLIPWLPRLMQKFEARIIISIGFALFATSNFMNLHMTGDYAADQLFWPNVVRALDRHFGVRATVRPLQQDAQSRRCCRRKREQYHSNVLMHSVSLFEQATRNRIEQLTQYFMDHGVPDPSDASHRAFVAIGKIVQKQVFVVAFSDMFFLLGGH